MALDSAFTFTGYAENVTNDFDEICRMHDESSIHVHVLRMCTSSTEHIYSYEYEVRANGLEHTCSAMLCLNNCKSRSDS